jgi:iron complex outermembrane receptor protein
MDVTDTAPFMRPHNRRVNYVYAQDEWAFIQDWYLTAGVRRDQYSDFGGTTNPRIALVWETAYNLTSKVLYGRAFRPPSFSELYAINNPVGLGNPNLKPETNESMELAFAWQAASSLQANLNLFRYQMKDILRFVQDTTTGISTAQNAGRQHGQGMEVELVWDARTNLRLSGNYAQQHSIDESTNQDAVTGASCRVGLWIHSSTMSPIANASRGILVRPLPTTAPWILRCAAKIRAAIGTLPSKCLICSVPTRASHLRHRA